MSLFLFIVLGVAAGWLASQIMRDSGYGQNGEIVLGIAGGVVGGILAGLVLHENIASGFSIPTLAAAFVAAAIVISLSRVYKHTRAHA
jgi:uncharacterized membrane protein YeaQ/YmgE (transglycosylase-associated protein family)